MRGSAQAALAAVAAVVLIEGVVFSSSLPVIYDHCVRLGGDARWQGLMMALLSLPKIVFNPLFGRWADAVGRRPLLLLATLGTMTGSLGWALAPSLLWLAAARAATGVFGTQAALAQAVAADVTPPERRASAMGVLGAAFGSAFAFGPLVGGFVGAHFGTFALGWMWVGLQSLSLLIVLTLLPETRPAAGSRESDGLSDGATLRHPRVLAILAATLAVTVGTSIFMAAFTPVMSERYGFTRAGSGLGWALFGGIGIVIQGAAIRPVVARFGEPTTALAGLGLIAAGLGMLALEPGVAGFWTAIAMAGVGLALSTPAMTGLLSRQVGQQAQGALGGLQQAVLGLGRGGGNLLGGDLFQRGGTTGVFAPAAALALLSAALLTARATPRHTSKSNAHQRP